MLNWIDIIVKQEQYQDLLRQAEEERFMREALEGREQNIRLWQTIGWLWVLLLLRTN